jgi:hypothetical protein
MLSLQTPLEQLRRSPLQPQAQNLRQMRPTYLLIKLEGLVLEVDAVMERVVQRAAMDVRPITTVFRKVPT